MSTDKRENAVPGQIPKHVAVIMDGNGRWAKERGLPRVMGHHRGVESIRQVVKTAREIGVEFLTLYAFSKENWERPKEEVEFLMKLLSQYLDSELKELEKNQIGFNIIGHLKDLPEEIQKKIERNMEQTANDRKMLLTLALSYSGRTDILDAVKQLANRVKSGELKAEQIDEKAFSSCLSTAGMPDPDLLIRTSGEMRVSNFLLWQISYTELYVTSKCWPEFRREDFLEAIRNYESRERRFGRTETVKSLT